MADTSRTVTDMASNLFQDSQAAGSITPQDLRDFLETCQVKQGSIYVSTASATTIAGQANVTANSLTNMVAVETAVTKNGTIITGAKTGGMSPSVTVNSTPMSISGYASMATNDYLNIWVGNVDSTDNLVARMGQLTAHSLVT